MTSVSARPESANNPATDPGRDIIARLERLPLSSWQVKTRIVVGAATFFDAFDALAIAYVLPVLAPMWKLTPQSRSAC